MGEIKNTVEPLIKGLLKNNITVKFDDDDKQRPGWKFAQYEMQGVPVRIAVGKRDLSNNQIEVARRDTHEKVYFSLDNAVESVVKLLDDIQKNLFRLAKERLDANIHKVNSWEEFKEVLDNKGGFVYAHWDGTSETELKIKEETKATIRCIPLDNPKEEGKCIYSGKPSSQRVLFARAY
jgi:prolyl-tRNA synthetase